uniref:Transmembrane protein n=1 Tax=Neobodo designis TaxID=312471 RepID=A0A7S1KWS8_NEODS|mmetsp:Transcript_10418/g.32300  ORF Transcript_10418/g.32300 Transcript_10418/m.32300 type:complete len:162 (+) Transcript_10418:40-525(+)
MVVRWLVVLGLAVLFAAATHGDGSADTSPPVPTHYFTVRPPQSPAPPPPAAGTNSSSTNDGRHFGMSKFGIAALFGIVGVTYFLVLRMSQRAVAGDAYLLPYAESIERVLGGQGGVLGGGVGPRRYSTLSFDDADADAMRPAGGFDRAERAAALSDPRSRI